MSASIFFSIIGPKEQIAADIFEQSSSKRSFTRLKKA
jgi:hypothetical protein